MIQTAGVCAGYSNSQAYRHGEESKQNVVVRMFLLVLEQWKQDCKRIQIHQRVKQQPLPDKDLRNEINPSKLKSCTHIEDTATITIKSYPTMWGQLHKLYGIIMFYHSPTLWLYYSPIGHVL